MYAENYLRLQLFINEEYKDKRKKSILPLEYA
jgi:hypothetical protein